MHVAEADVLQMTMRPWPYDWLLGTTCNEFLNTCVVQGTYGGEDVVVKLFEPKSEGYAEAFVREVRTYERLQGLQGKLVPRLLRSGMLVHTSSLFLALSFEGQSLRQWVAQKGSGTRVNGAQREEMVHLVQSLHRCGLAWWEEGHCCICHWLEYRYCLDAPAALCLNLTELVSWLYS